MGVMRDTRERAHHAERICVLLMCVVRVLSAWGHRSKRPVFMPDGQLGFVSFQRPYPPHKVSCERVSLEPKFTVRCPSYMCTWRQNQPAVDNVDLNNQNIYERLALLNRDSLKLLKTDT